MNQPHIIAFANQKGGAGKSTITTHIASALRYIYGYSVAVVDVDYPQNSIQSYRREEQQHLTGTPEPDTEAYRLAETFKAKLIKQNITPYPIIVSSVEKAVESISGLFDRNFDFILVDTPGTVNVVGLPALLQLVDYIFLPMEPDKGTIASTMAYMGLLRNISEHKTDDTNLAGYYAFWNKYMKSEKKGIYDKTEAIFEEKQLPLLKSRIELLVTYKENRSTMFSLPESELHRLALGSLLSEILFIVLGEDDIVTPSGYHITQQQALLGEPNKKTE